MKNQKWDYNPQGNLMDETVRKLLRDALISETNIGVLDVGDNNIFWPADIDLLLVSNDYHIQTLEVKAVGFGNAKYNNVSNLTLFIEYISNDRKFLATGGLQGQGCTRICKADYYLFYFTKMDYYLLLKTEKLQEFLESNLEKYESKSAVTYGKNGEELYKSYGIIVPINALRQEAGAKLIKSNCCYATYEQAVLSERKNRAS